MYQACVAADRATQYGNQIVRDGVLIDGQNGHCAHPLAKLELASRIFVTRVLAHLGVFKQAVVKPVGRPPAQTIGITYEQLREREQSLGKQDEDDDEQYFTTRKLRGPLWEPPKR